jgi:cell division protein FtsA
MAGCRIHSVFAGIAGSHIISMNSHGIVAIRIRKSPRATWTGSLIRRALSPYRLIRRFCISCPRNALSIARRVSRNPSVCQAFVSRRAVHIVTGAVSAAQNIVKVYTPLRA